MCVCVCFWDVYHIKITYLQTFIFIRNAEGWQFCNSKTKHTKRAGEEHTIFAIHSTIFSSAHLCITQQYPKTVSKSFGRRSKNHKNAITKSLCTLITQRIGLRFVWLLLFVLLLVMCIELATVCAARKQS